MRKLIDILLFMHGIEINPGPVSHNNTNNLTIRTFNCNGLGDTNKLRRLLTKARSEVNKGGVILLQETHIKDVNLLKLYWKMNFTFSGISTRSAGVITLFDNSFECLETFTDNAGR
jgi:hypothetical protein